MLQHQHKNEYVCRLLECCHRSLPPARHMYVCMYSDVPMVSCFHSFCVMLDILAHVLFSMTDQICQSRNVLVIDAAGFVTLLFHAFPIPSGHDFSSGVSWVRQVSWFHRSTDFGDHLGMILAPFSIIFGIFGGILVPF